MKKLMMGLVLVAMAVNAQALVIATYDFQGSVNMDTIGYENMTAGAFTVNTGTSVYTTSFSSAWLAAGGAVPVIDSGAGWTATSQSASTKYWQFTLTPTPGFELTLTGLNFIYQATGAGPQNIGWSIGGTSYDSFARAGTAPTAYVSGAQWITITSATTIHIDGWGATSTGNFRIDNVVVYGGFYIFPEPTTMSLLALGALAMVIHRRMKK